MTMHLQAFKRRLHELGPPRAPAGAAPVAARLGQIFAAGHVLHAGCPIDDCTGFAEQTERFWGPLLAAFPDLERRDDILMGGRSEVAPVGADWVALTGHYVGTFARPWLRIPPTGRVAWIRYGAFHRVEDGTIVESYLLLDLPGLMRQAGVCPLPPAPAVEVLIPGPASQDGLILTDQDAAETARSMALVKAMIGGLHRFDRQDLTSMGMPTYWHPDMMWYGPAGVGSTRGVAGFQQQYQRHFLHAFPDRVGGDHKARFAEGAYVATTGWPSIRASFAGDWVGRPASGLPISLRVMDFWRRDGDLLRENWVFIDLPDFLRQTGADIFAGLPA